MATHPASWPPPKRRVSDWRGSAFSVGTLLVLLVLGWFLYRIRSAVLVLVASLFVAYVLEPPVARLATLRIGRGRELGRRPAAAIVVLATVAVIAWCLWMGVPVLFAELQRLASELPSYYKIVEDWLARMAARRGMGLPTEFWLSVADQIHDALGQALSGLTHQAFVLAKAVPQVIGVLIIPVGGFYILADGITLRRDFVNGLPAAWRPQVSTVLDDAHRSLEAYVRGQTLVCLVAGTIAATAFTLLHVRFSLALGIMAGLAEAIPFIGSLTVVVSLVVLTTPEGLGRAATVVGTYVFLNQINNYFITPRLIGSRLELHPFVVIVAVLAGGALGGFLGAVLALPTAAVLIAVGGHAWGLGRPASWARGEPASPAIPPGGPGGA